MQVDGAASVDRKQDGVRTMPLAHSKVSLPLHLRRNSLLNQRWLSEGSYRSICPSLPFTARFRMILEGRIWSLGLSSNSGSRATQRYVTTLRTSIVTLNPLKLRRQKPHEAKATCRRLFQKTRVVVIEVGSLFSMATKVDLRVES